MYKRQADNIAEKQINYLCVLRKKEPAFAAGYYKIDVYKRQDYVKRHDFKFFGAYRIVLGIIVLAVAAATAIF